MIPIILAFIAIGSGLVWYLLHHDHGRRLPPSSLWTAFGFGIAALILAGLLETQLFPKSFWVAPQLEPIGLRFLFFMGVGILEEAAKFVPLALFIYSRPYFREHTDGVIYFAICGLTFGLGENILYTLSFGSKVGIERLVITPFLHAATTGIIGYYLASRKIDRKYTAKFIVAAALIPFMHGVYDFGVYSGQDFLLLLSLLITLLLTLGLFLYFMQANDLDKAAIARAAAQTSRFCPRCGRPNMGQKKFCEFCGQPL